MISKKFNLLLKEEGILKKLNVIGLTEHKIKKIITSNLRNIGLHLLHKDLTIEFFYGSNFIIHLGLDGRLKLWKFEKENPEYFI